MSASALSAEDKRDITRAVIRARSAALRATVSASYLACLAADRDDPSLARFAADAAANAANAGAAVRDAETAAARSPATAAQAAALHAGGRDLPTAAVTDEIMAPVMRAVARAAAEATRAVETAALAAALRPVPDAHRNNPARADAALAAAKKFQARVERAARAAIDVGSYARSPEEHGDWDPQDPGQIEIIYNTGAEIDASQAADRAAGGPPSVSDGNPDPSRALRDYVHRVASDPVAQAAARVAYHDAADAAELRAVEAVQAAFGDFWTTAET
jgi:hypothetical protein